MLRTAAVKADRSAGAHPLFRSAFLRGVSAVALVLAASGAAARPLGVSYKTSATSAASEAAVAAAAAAQAAARQSQASINRALQAIQAMRAVQGAARSAAGAAGTNGVTDGLSSGGLIVDPRVRAGTDATLWVNANLPTQTTSNGQTTVTVQQTSQRAVMTWQQFNVGRNTIVNFDQSAGNSSNGNNWIALNRVDASGVPSQIQGQINAQGTVMIINPNGIIFTGTSQINVHTLIASSLDINSYNGSGAPNVGAFNVANFNNSNGAGTYVNVSSGTGGPTLLAPPNEDNANTSFLSNGLYVNYGGGGTLIFAAGLLPNQVNQGIVVAPGALITGNVGGFDNGGYVALVGPQVSNAGTISAPAGQIMLAASPNVLISQPSNAGAALTATTFRSVSSPGDLAYTAGAVPGGASATNQAGGILSATRGAVTLIGDNVNALGGIEVDTSITRAGSVTVYANALATLGSNSVISILPDENGEAIPLSSASAFVVPSINIQAASFDMKGTAQGAPGALIVAPGAAMKVATTALYDPLLGGTTPAGRALLESGSVIDLAGLNATASIANYLYTFKVTANDVADSPLAANLIGQTVTIDLRRSGTRADGLAWVGSPLFSSTGLNDLNNLPRTISQLLSSGGTLKFATTADGTMPFSDVLQQSGSIVNIAGGAIHFNGGVVATTRLLGSNGRLYDIGSADPSVAYLDIAGRFVVDHAHWGISEIYTSPLTSSGHFELPYTDGMSAGSVTVAAINPILEGTLLAGTTTGDRQRELAQSGTGANGSQASPDELPSGGSLSITALGLSSTASETRSAVVVLDRSADPVLGSDVTMNSALNIPTVLYPYQIQDGTVTTNKANLLTYSTDRLSAAHLSSISISAGGALSVATGAELTVQDGGSIALNGITTMDGALIAHGGKVSLTGYTGGREQPFLPPVSQVVIGPHGLIDVSGRWVNDAGARGGDVIGSAFVNGGSVSIQTYIESTASGGNPYTLNGTNIFDTTQSIDLAPGSIVDLSSGGYVQTNGKLKLAANGLPVGNGGSLSLKTYVSNPGNSPGWRNNAPSNDFQGVWGNFAPNGSNRPNQANVFIEGTIYSGGLNIGGTFALQAPIIQIGGVSAVTSGTAGSTTSGEIDLPAAFFASNGFSNYSLTSTYGSVSIVGGTTIHLQQKNYQSSGPELPGSGSSLRSFASFGLAPDGLRLPTNLALNQTGYVYGGANDPSTSAGILLDQGAAILGEPGAKIALTANGPVTVLGDITAQGGSIALTNNGRTLGPTATLAPLDVWVGPQAVLNVSGTFIANPNPLAYPSGKVLDAGSIVLSGGTVVTMPGSLLDLSGANTTIALPSGGQGNAGTSPIWSNGGTLSVVSTAGDGSAYLGGIIHAFGGSPLAAGGQLVLGNAASVYGAVIIPQSGRVTDQFNATALASSGPGYPTSRAELAALLPTTDSDALIAADTLNNSGLSSVALVGGTIAFSGNVTINVPGSLTLAGQLALLPAGHFTPTFTAPSIGATVVDIRAGYLLLAGSSGGRPHLSDGTLNLAASAQIDLAGGISISNAANVNLVSGGDIRLLAPTDPMFSVGPFAGGGYFPLSQIALQSMVQVPGALIVADNLTLTAREVYPTTDSAFLLMSASLAPADGMSNTVRIASNGSTPVAPLSADGMVLVDAQNIVQAGALIAPLGTIQLGLAGGQQLPSLFTSAFSLPAAVTSQSVIAAGGSLTSVSAAGLEIPYGTTINNGGWSAVSPVLGDRALVPAETAPPSKNVVLNGQSVSTAPGAVIDLSGGGDVYASEFVQGTGGSRNVLTEAGAGQAVYALVPGYVGAIAANDTIYGQAVPVGTSVTLSGGNGVAAGTYTLMPASYAMLPGAYRIVVVSTNATPSVRGSVAQDGSIYMTGTLGNTITGQRSSQTALLEIQSKAVWSRYSEIDIAHGNSYFAGLAAANGVTAPLLPIDGGVLTVNAVNALNLQATNRFAPAEGGRGGTVAIAGSNILVRASDLATPAADANAGYIVLDADQLSNLGATTVLIGGTVSLGASGRIVAATAANLEIETDAAHALSAPELLLVTQAVDGANGLTVDAGSVIAAAGTVPNGSDVAITMSPASGSLLRVSNGAPIGITRTKAQATGASLAIGTTPGTSTIAAMPGAAVRISGVSLALDTSGSAVVDLSAVLAATNYALSGNVINLGNVPAGSAGLTISPQLIAQFAGAQQVTLRSNSVINFYDQGGIDFGTSDNPIGTLTLDSATLQSAGGSTRILAGNIDLANSVGSTAPSALPGAGALSLTALRTLTLDTGTKQFSGFANVALNAGSAIAFAGGGSLDAGSAAVTLAAPDIVVMAASSQSLTTTGALAIRSVQGSPANLASTTIGGVLNLTGGSISDSGRITAISGQLALTATSGDLVLDRGASIVATGSHIALFDAVEDAPGGTVKLTASTGNVAINNGASIDVSATGLGFAGALAIATGDGKVATLDGTLRGGAAYNDLGGRFALSAGQLIGDLPINSGFTASFAVALQQGDIVVPMGANLTSGQVVLSASHGSVIVDGTIDASGPTGGVIELYGSGTGTAAAGTAGATGVTIGSQARLIAAYRADDPKDPASGNGQSALVQNGGLIVLGTSGTPDGDTNSAYGYENVSGSGAITVAPGALFDVSGGDGGPNISNAGGTIVVRAPLLKDGTVNVQFAGSVVATINGRATGNSIALNAYATWSTNDGSSSAAGQHFDGIIDPAGWFSNTGAALPGLDQFGYAIKAPTPQSPLQTGEFFTPDTPNADHVKFYQTTLVNFVQSGLDPTAAAAGFAGALGVSLGTTLHLQPEIDLVNPSRTVNSGNITVASNWNLGAGTADGAGRASLYYRTKGGVDAGEPGVLNVGAVNGVQVNATVSDGFFVPYQSTSMPTIISGQLTTPGVRTPGQTLPAPNVAIQAYQDLINNDPLYASYVTGLDSNGNFVYLMADGSTASASDIFAGYLNLSRVGPAVLQAPATFSSGDTQIIDQYNQFYAAYVGLFRIYETNTAAYQYLFATAGQLGLSTPANLPPQAPTAATAASYATQGTGYIWQYAQYMLDNNAVNGGAGASAPALSSQNLAGVLNTLNAYAYAQDQCYPCMPYAAPFPPYFALTNGQPDVTSLPAVQSGYVPTPPIVLPPVVTPPVGFVAPTLATPATPAQVAAAAAAMADAIANNPGLDATLNPQYNATSSSPLMTIGFAQSRGSFSYRFTAGAKFDPITGALNVDPNAVIDVPANVVTVGSNPSFSVTVDGHSSYRSGNAVNLGAHETINIPTLVRSGTGSITVNAAGSFELLDTTAPGAVYTAGAALATQPSDFTAPTLPSPGALSRNGLLTDPVWAVGGGSVTIRAGTDIVGIEAPTDDNSGSQTTAPSALTGEFWSAWYYRAGLANGQQVAPFGGSGSQYSTWINYGTFFQGIGALGGGNVTLKAGADIADISASLPETIQVGGGQSASGPAAHAYYYGGGDLVVEAGGNLLSSTFYVGRGTGSINIAGAIVTDPRNPITGTPTTYLDAQVSNGTPQVYGRPQPLPLLLALQDGFVNISAGQTVSLGGVFDPAAVPQDLGKLDAPAPAAVGLVPAGTGALFRTYGANSGVGLTSLTGDVNVITVSDFNPAAAQSGANGRTSLFALRGENIFYTTMPASLTASSLLGNVNLRGDVSLMPSASGQLSLMAGQSISTETPTANGYYAVSLTMLEGTTVSTDFIPSLYGVPTPVTLRQAWHTDDRVPAVIYAGEDIKGRFSLIKPARVEAGRDIINMVFLGQNNTTGDITSIIAGRDIIAPDVPSSLQLYGPGAFLVSAGRNLGPFFPAGFFVNSGVYAFTGIATLGDGSNLANGMTKLYLPTTGADLYTQFGVGQGINYAAAIEAYVNPASAGTGGIDFLGYIAAALGDNRTDAWTTFQALPALRQHLLIDQAYLKFLSQAGIDYNDVNSPYYHQYARAYAVINTLFPAAKGYTDNAPTGVAGGVNTVSTGDLSMAHSLVETQSGGNIFLVGPGGNIVVGANAADTSLPQQEGILTLQGGSILSYTDQSVQVYQSRIFTEQGGDIDMFSANGDLNAGKGPKSKAAFPPLSVIWDTNGYARVNPAGLVTGAGIGALLSLPGQDPDLSNVNLVAPRGTVDAGAAGIRVSGNLNIAALQVLNAFNITIGGSAAGIPTVQGPPVAALSTAANTAGSAVRTEAPAQNQASDATSVIVVEFLGFGGGDDDASPPARQRDQKPERRSEQPSYNTNSAFQIIGTGELSEEQKQRFSLSERKRLAGEKP